MTRVLASSRIFSPWYAEAATTASAWLVASGADSVDVIRADLGSQARAVVRPEVDARVRHTTSIDSAEPPQTWADLATYAESAFTALTSWRAAGGAWDVGYSGPEGLGDHLVLALARARGLVPSWTAHLGRLPTHDAGGARINDVAEADDSLAGVCRGLAESWHVPFPRDGDLAPAMLALIAGGSDRIVVASEELAEILCASPQWRTIAGIENRIEVWARPGRTWERATVPGRTGITAYADSPRLPLLDPVLRAYALLDAAERARVGLTIATDDPAAATALVRLQALEEAVPVLAPAGVPAPCADLALVVDWPVPAGRAFDPVPPPELADAAASGVPVILLAPQDSPLTRAAVAHHLPTEHVSAARALLARLPVELEHALRT